MPTGLHLRVIHSTDRGGGEAGGVGREWAYSFTLCQPRNTSLFSFTVSITCQASGDCEPYVGRETNGAKTGRGGERDLWSWAVLREGVSIHASCPGTFQTIHLL